MTFWKGLYRYGRVFFEASSQQHAHALMQKWGAVFELGSPDVIKRCKPSDLNPDDLHSGAYIQRGNVWVEQ